MELVSISRIQCHLRLSLLSTWLFGSPQYLSTLCLQDKKSSLVNVRITNKNCVSSRSHTFMLRVMCCLETVTLCRHSTTFSKLWSLNYKMVSQAFKDTYQHCVCDLLYYLIGHVNIGIVFLLIGNSRWCLINTQSKSYCLLNIHLKSVPLIDCNCKLIGWY